MKVAVPPSFEVGSGAGEASGCVNGVLHWILCRNLRERRCIDEEEAVGLGKEERGKTVAVSAASSNPGIVARLMGLEPLPAFPYAQPEKISRTRSANSAEAWKGPGLLGEPAAGDGGSELRKSQSFREVRSYLRKESEEFLVLSFGDDDESEALALSAKKTDLSFELCGAKESRGERNPAEKKKRSRNKSSVSSSEIKHFSGSEKGINPSETAERSSSCRKKISFSQGEMEIECSSQNSSPVSVLDLPLDEDGDSLTSPDSFISVCKVSSLKSVEEDSRKNGGSSAIEDEGKRAGKSGTVAQDLPDIWGQICRLGEEDLNSSEWVNGKTIESEGAEEIGFEVGRAIFELLLNEAALDLFF